MNVNESHHCTNHMLVASQGLLYNWSVIIFLPALCFCSDCCFLLTSISLKASLCLMTHFDSNRKHISSHQHLRREQPTSQMSDYTTRPGDTLTVKPAQTVIPLFMFWFLNKCFIFQWFIIWLMSPYAHQHTPAGCCCSNQRNIKALKTVFQSVWTLNAISWYLCIKDDSATFINQNLIPDDRLFSTEALNIVNIVGQTPSPPFFLVVPSHSWWLYVC